MTCWATNPRLAVLLTVALQGCYLGGEAYPRGGLETVRFDSGPADFDAGSNAPDSGAPIPGSDSGIAPEFDAMTNATDGGPGGADAASGCGVCTPGAIGTGFACGNCGMQRRVCRDDCTWSDYVCEGEGVCSRGQTRNCANDDRCGVERCNSECQWGGCEPIVDPALGGCLHTRPGTTTGGNHFRCCDRSATERGWEFCLPPNGSGGGCRWSGVCEQNAACAMM